MILNNVDGLLNDPNAQGAYMDQTPAAKEIADNMEPAYVPATPQPYLAPDEPPPIATEKTQIIEQKEPEPTKNADIDDYGNPIVKQTKTYTEAEVQAMIRDRLSRVKQEQFQPPPQTQQPHQPQQEGQELGWEQELEYVIENTIAKREQKKAEQHWKQQEDETQANFEIRFNQGAARYNDFGDVMAGKPLTPEMVIATRGMEDPAAFLYAAAKTQAPELGRIAKINDPYAQAIELGRLEERMRRARPSGAPAARPIAPVSGDVTDKDGPRYRNVDDKLLEDQRNWSKDKMRGRNM